jgi:hypothetical protein
MSSEFLLEPRPLRTIGDALTDTNTISAAADRIVVARVVTGLSRQIKEGKLPQLLEINGLGAAVSNAKKSIATLRDAASGFHAESSGLAKELTDLTEQIRQHRADLRFEAETLGNGGSSEFDQKSES